MGLKLYMYESSLPARSVLMTAAALGIKLEKKIVDMMKGEHTTPEFLKVTFASTFNLLVVWLVLFPLFRNTLPIYYTIPADESAAHRSSFGRW